MGELDPALKAKLEELKGDLSAIDPEFAEIDVSDAEGAIALMVIAAAVKGLPISVTTEDDKGHTETLELTPQNETVDGAPLVKARMTNNGGTFSPEAAGMIAHFSMPGVEAGFDSILGEAPSA